MFHRLLVSLDGFARAEHAIPVAAHIARTTGSSILFLRVVPFPVEYEGGGVQPAPFIPGDGSAEQSEATR